MAHTLIIPDDVRTMYVTSFPEGHPNGPWQIDFILTDGNRWRRGQGATPQEAVDSVDWIGGPIKKQSYTIENYREAPSKPLPAGLADIELDL